MNRIAAVVVTSAAFLMDSRVWACATCFGAPDDPQTKGMNAAILTLLGITYTLFAGMFAAAFVLWRRARRTADAESKDGAPATGLEPHHG